MDTVRRDRLLLDLLVLCPYCQKPFFLAIPPHRFSDALWNLDRCPNCYSALEPALPGTSASLPWILEHIACEVYAEISTTRRGDRLRLTNLSASCRPITKHYLKTYRAKRAPLRLDVLTWITIAAASGIVGNLSYAAIMRLIERVRRRGRSPGAKLTRPVDKTDYEEWKEVTLTQTEVRRLTTALIRYSSRRLRLIKIEHSRRRREYRRQRMLEAKKPSLNHASLPEILKTRAMTRVVAEEIMRQRPFRSYIDLMTRVHGVGPVRTKALQERFRI